MRPHTTRHFGPIAACTGVLISAVLSCNPVSLPEHVQGTAGPRAAWDGVLTVEVPNGGEVLAVGQTCTLRVSQDASANDMVSDEYHDVTLYLTDGDVLDPPLGVCNNSSFDIVSSGGCFEWTIPESVFVRGAQDPATGAFSWSMVPFPRSARFRLIVSSYEALCADDSSDAAFEIR